MSDILKIEKQEKDKIRVEKTFKVEPVPPEVTQKAWELVKDPAFFYKLGQLFEKGFYVPSIKKCRFVLNEERNKRLAPILIPTAITRLLGPIGTAKDTIVRMTIRLLQRALKILERTHLTPGVLKYSPFLKNADVLYIPDAPALEGEEGRQFRFMRADDGGIAAEYTVRDKETGEFTTLISNLNIKNIVTTTNEIRIDRALESGSWTIETNESEELTQKVKLEKLKAKAGKHEYASEEEVLVWQEAFRILLQEDKVEGDITIPYAEALMPLLENPRSESRRDPDKLCDLIEKVAFFRRFQKPREKWNEADLVDFYIALQLGLDAIRQTFTELKPEEKILCEILDEHGTLTTKEIATKVKQNQRAILRKLEFLIDKGYVVKGKKGRENEYSLIPRKHLSNPAIFDASESSDPVQEMASVLSLISIQSLGQEGYSVVDPITGEILEIRPQEGKIKLFKVKNDSKNASLTEVEGYTPWRSDRIQTEAKADANKQKDKKDSDAPKMAESSESFEEKEPNFAICNFCGKPILEGESWIQNAFTEYKRVHRKCYHEVKDGVKNE
jgi:hypothetical protein